MAADGNTTQCCIFGRRSTTVVALLSTHQPPRERLVRVLPVDLASETRTSTVSGAGETGQCSATGSGKNNVCLRIVPDIVRGKGELVQIMTNTLLDPGSDVT